MRVIETMLRLVAGWGTGRGIRWQKAGLEEVIEAGNLKNLW